MNIAVILAGGIGARLGAEMPKQFLKVLGKTIIEYTLDIFEQHPYIDEIAIVSNAFYTTEMEVIVRTGNYKKVKKILEGGTERHNSSQVAIEAYQNYPEANLLIHDAVRPMIDSKTIDELIYALEKYNAVTVAVPVTDTIYQVEHNLIQQIPNRKYLMRAQTPQGFKQYILQEAYLQAFQSKGFIATDDCSVVAKYMPNDPIFVVTGIERNLKITHKEDLYLLEKLLT